MSYKSNMNAVMVDLTKKLKGIKTEPIEREIAVSLATSNANRIHNEGKNVAGGKIGTYKPVTMKIRRTSKKINPKNRSGSTDIILSFTGKLSKELQAAPIPNGWGVGFTSSYSSELFKIFTDRFGNIWGITNEDQKAIDKIIEREINKKIGKS